MERSLGGAAFCEPGLGQRIVRSRAVATMLVVVFERALGIRLRVTPFDLTKMVMWPGLCSLFNPKRLFSLASRQDLSIRGRSVMIGQQGVERQALKGSAVLFVGLILFNRCAHSAGPVLGEEVSM